jgi:5-methylcytosine-specific restriction protein B
VGDQWAWRDLLADMSRVDERVTALLSLVVHPGSFTTLLRKIDREKVVAAFADRLPDLTGDLDRDLHAVVVALQAENGGHGVDLNAPPLVNAWSGSVDTGGAWLVRGQVDRRDRVPAWVSQNMVTLTVGRFRQMPADPTQATLTALVDELYSDQPVIKREGKKRDVLAFALGMRPGDLVATDDSGRLRLGRVQEGDAALDSIGGTTLLTRPVAWSSSNEMKITELPGTVRSRLRFKGEDIVNLTEILDELESLEAGASDVGGAAVAEQPHEELVCLACSALEFRQSSPDLRPDLVTGVPGVIDAGDELPDADVPERWCLYLEVFQAERARTTLAQAACPLPQVRACRPDEPLSEMIAQ